MVQAWKQDQIQANEHLPSTLSFHWSCWVANVRGKLQALFCHHLRKRLPGDEINSEERKNEERQTDPRDVFESLNLAMAQDCPWAFGLCTLINPLFELNQLELNFCHLYKRNFSSKVEDYLVPLCRDLELLLHIFHSAGSVLRTLTLFSDFPGVSYDSLPIYPATHPSFKARFNSCLYKEIRLPFPYISCLLTLILWCKRLNYALLLS